MEITSSESEVTNYMTAEELLDKVKIGYLIEIKRKGVIYEHWVVYVGNGYAIHLYLPSKTAKIATVKKERLVDICDGDKCRINNHPQLAQRRRLEAQDPSKIVKDAEEAIGQTVEYNVLGYNCEYFATACRYGEAFCGQVERPSDSLINWGTVCVVAGAAAVAVGHLLKMPGRHRNN